MAYVRDAEAYIFKASVVTPKRAVEMLGETWGFSVDHRLDELAAERGIDRTDEASFDSDDFPKCLTREELLEYGRSCLRDSISEGEFYDGSIECLGGAHVTIATYTGEDYYDQMVEEHLASQNDDN